MSKTAFTLSDVRGLAEIETAEKIMVYLAALHVGGFTPATGRPRIYLTAEQLARLRGLTRAEILVWLAREVAPAATLADLASYTTLTEEEVRGKA